KERERGAAQETERQGRAGREDREDDRRGMEQRSEERERELVVAAEDSSGPAQDERPERRVFGVGEGALRVDAEEGRELTAPVERARLETPDRHVVADAERL